MPPASLSPPPLHSAPQSEALSSRLESHLRGGGSLSEWMGVDEADLEAAYALAGFFYGRDEYDTALRIYGMLLMGQPFDRRFALGMAMCKQMLQQHEDALGYYANALLMDFDDPLPSYHMAECLMQLGKRSEALHCLSVCLRRATGPEHTELSGRALDLQQLLLASGAPAPSAEAAA